MIDDNLAQYKQAVSEAEKAGFFQKSAALEKVSALALKVLAQIPKTEDVKKRSDEYIKLGLSIGGIKKTLDQRNIIQKIFDSIFSKGAKSIEKACSTIQSDDKFHESLNAETLKITEDKNYKSIPQQIGFRIAPNMNMARSEELGLEGSASILSLKLIGEDLLSFYKTHEEQLSKNEREIIQEHLGLLDNAKEISRKIECADLMYRNNCVENCDKILQNTAKTLSEQIKALPPDKFVLIPGGYVRESGIGHAVVYKVKNEGDGKYSLEIFNTGEGCLRQSTPTELQSTKARSIKVKNCTLENISDPKFLEKICECYAKPITRNMKEVCKQLSRFPAWKEGTLTRGDKYPLQTRGSCTFDSIMVALKGSLPRHLYHAFKLDMVQKSALKVKETFSAEIHDEISALAEETVQGQKKIYERKVDNWTSDEYKTRKIAKVANLAFTHKAKVEKHLKAIEGDFFRLKITKKAQDFNPEDLVEKIRREMLSF